jgi:hypothetical protein
MAEQEQPTGDGQHRVAGVPGEITISGKTYRLSPPTLRMRADIIAHLASQRKSPIEVLPGLLEKLPAEYHDQVIRATIQQATAGRLVLDEDFREYLNSFEGTAHLLWLLLRTNHPELDSLAKVLALVEEFHDKNLLELWGRIDQATGFLTDVAALGNLPGHDQTKTGTAAA